LVFSFIQLADITCKLYKIESRDSSVGTVTTTYWLIRAAITGWLKLSFCFLKYLYPFWGLI